ncbi:MAG: glycosyltransferase [Candidatus Acidiferrales bacterium]
MNKWPRVAFFSDSYHGVDGVATTCRNVVAAARERRCSLLAIHSGERTRQWTDGSVEFLELDRGPLSVNIDLHLRFDLLFVRHYARALEAARKFRADVVHITGPGDVGITGARVAAALKVPLVAAWHTNLHEFAGRRLGKLASPLPGIARDALTSATEKFVLWACAWFYGLAQVALAPNKEQMRLISSLTGRPVFPMRRGVNRELFSPAKRDVRDHIFRLGYVGRLCPEKNVRFLADVEQALRRDGIDRYRFLIVGDGGERAWLERKLIQADFTGELHGEFLARAYANMDLFVFPSETDTYGNVVAEAQASGVPALVTSKGGPKYQVREGVTGFVGTSAEDFIAKAKRAVIHPELYQSLREATCRATTGQQWDNVLDDLADAYWESLQPGGARSAREALLAS